MFNNYPMPPYQSPTMGYPQPQFQMPQPQQNVAQPQADDRIFVANIDAANAYLVAPGGFARLWDSGVNRFYEKRADLSGRQFPMMVYEYREYKPAPEQPTALPDYESRFKAIEDRLAAFESRGEANSNG